MGVSSKDELRAGIVIAGAETGQCRLLGTVAPQKRKTPRKSQGLHFCHIAVTLVATLP